MYDEPRIGLVEQESRPERPRSYRHPPVLTPSPKTNQPPPRAAFLYPPGGVPIMSNGARDSEGRYASQNFESVYDALNREMRRMDQLRAADQTAILAALAAAEKANATALTAAKEAVDKAESNQRRVNEGQNEFRAALKDQAANLMPRAETELLIKGNSDRLSVLEQSRGTEAGRKQGQSATLTTLLAVVTTVAVVSGAIAGILVNLLAGG